MQHNRLVDFLAELDLQDIAYVSWKNNHQLQDSLLGTGDIDLFVPVDKKSKFIQLCRACDWIEVVNPVFINPWVAHFCRLGDGCAIYHIHVYFKIISGETWIKEYSIPLDKWMLENRIWNEDHKVWVLNDMSQAYIFLIRHLLKCGSLTGRLLYKREIDSYEKEWKHCSYEIEPNEIRGPIDLSPYFDGSRVFGNKLNLPTLKTAFLFRLTFSSFLRYRSFSLPLRRLRSFLLRFRNKFLLKRKKLFPEVGLTIAISGVDGSGKTTMLEEVDKALGKFLTIDRYHLGRPQGKLIEFIWRLFGNKSENSDMPGTSDVKTPSSKLKSMNGAILALLRLRKAKLVIKRSNLGGVVLIDRWPTREVGKMDGPRVILGKNSGWIQRLSKHIETWAYANIPQVDICYFFVVPMEVASERNRLRIKENKETEQQIKARFFGNVDFNPISAKTIRFDNSGNFTQKYQELLDSIWQEISSRY